MTLRSFEFGVIFTEYNVQILHKFVEIYSGIYFRVFNYFTAPRIVILQRNCT